MKVYEYAKANGMTNDEVKAKFGLKSHLSLVPFEALHGDVSEEIEAPAPASVAKTAIPEAKELSIPCPVSLEVLKQSIQIHGGASPVYKWRHLIDGNCTHISV